VGDDIRILVVCTHNRTRSLIGAVLLAEHLQGRGIEAVVESAGTGAQGLPATEGAFVMLRDHGFDVSDHVSRQVDEELASSADLILVAEPEHVVWIAGRWPRLFRRTFTIPEFLDLIEDAGPVKGREFHDWLEDLATRRHRVGDYLRVGVLRSIADPTGGPPDAWRETFDELNEAAASIASSLRDRVNS
jgi:protein-tyrosine phosphatase